MTKIQKILIGLFIAMVVMPEILWSPVGNSVYEWNQKTNHVVPLRPNFLTISNNIDAWSNVLLLQFIGSVLLFVYLILVKNNIQNKIIRRILLFATFILSCFIFYYYSLSTIRITF